MQEKKIIIFDLDGTLAESKQPIDSEMAELLAYLLEKHVVAVISGGKFFQFQKAILEKLPLGVNLNNLVILPTTGASLFIWDHEWISVYEFKLKGREIRLITEALNDVLSKTGFDKEPLYGERIENRLTQVTYSGLGQLAPLSEKEVWDPDQEKRKKIVKFLAKELEDFSVKIGGATSIDITRKGIDKAFGIKRLEQYLHITKPHIKDILFVGDALFPGGNDAPAKLTGVDCVQVESVKDTKTLIKAILK